MKRIIILIIAILLTISFAPTSAFANEQSSITTSEAIKLACEVFPEYEAEIKGEKLTSASFSRNLSNSEFSEFIIEETRQADNGREITYQQAASGLVFVTFSYGSTLVNSSYGTGYAYRKCNLVMYCNVSDELLQVNNFEYTHVHNGYDAISSYGTTSASTATVRYVIGNTQENSTIKAFVQYHVSFTLNKEGLSGEIDAYLKAEVGNDNCTYSAVGE